MKWVFSFFSLACICSCCCESELSYNQVTQALPMKKSSDTSLVTHENEFCLPSASQRFLSWKESDSLIFLELNNEKNFIHDEIYFYLITHLDSAGTKKIIRADDFYGPIEWEQEFKNGISYRYIRHPEIGNAGILQTTCTDKKDFIQVIQPVIVYRSSCENCDNPTYSWNKDSTRYEPTEVVPGCYYEIKQNDQNFISLEWYCGC